MCYGYNMIVPGHGSFTSQGMKDMIIVRLPIFSKLSRWYGFDNGCDITEDRHLQV